VRERHFDHLGRITRALGRPIAEGRAEAVRDVAGTRPHAPDQLKHRHVGQRPAGSPAYEHELAFTRERRQQFDGARGERDAMFFAGLHSPGRYNPYSGIEVDLGPTRADCLACPRGAEDRELKRLGADAVPAPQLADELRQFDIGHGRMVLDRADLAPVR
jgi:hypothetical protein